MKRILSIFALLAFAGVARAQGIPQTITILGPTGGLKAGATVTICNFPATGGVPCTNTVSLFSDVGLTVSLANPMTTNAFGTVTFFTAVPTNGILTYTVTGAGTASPQGPYNLLAFGNSTPGGTSGQIQFNNAAVLSGIAGSAVTAATGATVLTAGADTTMPLAIASHSATQSAPLFDVNNQSSGTADTPFTLRGLGLGSFTPGAGKSLLHYIQESDTSYAWIVTNHTADVAKGGANLAVMDGKMFNDGTSEICGGGIPGDSNNNYGCLLFGNASSPANETITAKTACSNCVTNIVPFNVQGEVNQSVDMFDVLKSDGTVLGGFNKSGIPFYNGSTIVPGSAICAPQGPIAAITGTGSAATYFTCTIPASILGTGHGVRLTTFVKHTTGTASVTYTMTFGGTSTTAVGPAGSANQIERLTYEIKNNAGVTNAQVIGTVGQDSNGGTNSIKVDTAAIDTTSAVIVNLQFNVANTDQITPEMFFAEPIQ